MDMEKDENSLILDNYVTRRKVAQSSEICEKKKKRDMFKKVNISYD